MKKILLLTGLVLCFLSPKAQTNSLQYYFNEAKEAQKVGDNKKFYEMILEAHKLNPYHQAILYQAGIAAALNNKPEESITYLTKAVNIKADYDLNNADLKTLAGRKGFEDLKTLQAELLKKIIGSDTAFMIKDRSLHMESIAAGESRNVFYLGSIHKRKIVRTDEKGNCSDFTTSGQDGLCSVFGIKVDASKKILWACSSPMVEMENFDSTTTSGVYKYDLKTGKLISKYTTTEKKNCVLGDLALDPKGKVFTSDSRNNTIFTVNEVSGKLENYFSSEEFWSLQGLTFSEDGRYLFIADYVRGIFRLDTQSKTLKLLSQNFDLSTKAIDGLAFYNNSLIAIQNGIYPMRVTQYFLDNAKEQLTSYKIIDSGHPAFNEPTIGCLAKSSFYYVANSQWAGYDAARKIKPAAELQEGVILKVDLK